MALDILLKKKRINEDNISNNAHFLKFYHDLIMN